MLMSGVASSLTILARNTYLTIAVPLAYRGRAMSLLAGFIRLGSLIDPFITIGVIATTGEARLAFLVPVVSSTIALGVLVLFGRDDATDGSHGSLVQTTSLWRTMTERRDVLMRVGLPAGLIPAMRTSRQIVPLVGLMVGLDTELVALVAAICATVDFALF